MRRLFAVFLFTGLYACTTLHAQSLNSKIAAAAKTLVGQLKAKNKTTIAIADFTNPDGSVSALGRSMANKLRINIVKSAHEITIVNRAVLQKALAEEQLLKDGIIDPVTAKKIKFLGLQAVVVAEISNYGDNYSIEIQLIDTERSDMLGGDILEISQTETTRKLYENILSTGGGNVGTATGTKPASKSAGKTGYYPVEREVGGLIVKVESVKYRGKKLVVRFKVFNTFDTAIHLYVYAGGYGPPQTKINYEGDIYFSTKVTIANKFKSGFGYIGENVSGKAWIKGSVEYDNMPVLTSLSLLQIGYEYNNQKQKLILRDVPIE